LHEFYPLSAGLSNRLQFGLVAIIFF